MLHMDMVRPRLWCSLVIAEAPSVRTVRRRLMPAALAQVTVVTSRSISRSNRSGKELRKKVVEVYGTGTFFGDHSLAQEEKELLSAKTGSSRALLLVSPSAARAVWCVT